MSKFITEYRSNPRTYLYYRYRDMRARVNGKPDGGGKNTPWLGLPITERTEFIEWGLEDSSFKQVWKEWQETNFIGRGPTVHRIDRTKGYLLDNVTFVTHADKSRKHLEQGKATRARKKLIV